MPKEITQDIVKELFDCRDGELYWKISKNRRINIGDLAGYVKTNGYRAIQIDGKSYFAHRLIFLYHHGFLPEYLDHIDGDPSNNNIENIREATNQENCMNQKKTESYNGKPTSSIYKGVYWNKYHEKWQAQIVIGGKCKFIGRMKSEIDAAHAYNEVAIELFGKFAKLNECQPL